MRPLDYIGAIELAYDRTQDDESWLASLTKTVAPAFGDGQGTTGFFFDLRGDRAELGETVGVGDAHSREKYARLHDLGEATARRPQRVVYECDMFTLLSRVVGPDVVATILREEAIEAGDSLGLRANVGANDGVLFTSFVDKHFRIRNRPLWVRFASHVGAAQRLRQTRRTTSPEAAQAILGPRGRLEHGDERAVAARDELANAAKDMDRARGKLRRLDPDAATALWRAMVNGEWSLVDWVDHDGKRFLLVEENRVSVEGHKTLTDREREVVAYAAMGHSNKLIAYDLGISTGTVSVMLSRAAAKLGVSGRVALIRAFKENGS